MSGNPCGYGPTVDYLLERFPQMEVATRGNQVVVLAPPSVWPEIASRFKVEARSEFGRLVLSCPICGDLSAMSCDPAKHAAYYDAMEKERAA